MTRFLVDAVTQKYFGYHFTLFFTSAFFRKIDVGVVFFLKILAKDFFRVPEIWVFHIEGCRPYKIFMGQIPRIGNLPLQNHIWWL